MCSRVMSPPPPAPRLARMNCTRPLFLPNLFPAELPNYQVCVNMKRISGAGGAEGRCAGSNDSGSVNLPDGKNGWRWHSRCKREQGRQDYVGSIAAKRRDRRDDYAEVALWAPQSRSLNANLAGVFREEGIDHARRQSAAAIAGRTELLARCYSTLRVALQDVIEWKVGGARGV